MLNRTCMFLCGIGLVSGLAVAAPKVVAADTGPVSASQEDESEGGFYVNIGAGGMRLHNADGYKGSNLRSIQESLVLRLGWDFEDSPWGVEVSGMFAPDVNRANHGNGRHENAYGLGLEGLYHLCDRYAAFDPFLAAGVGVYGGQEIWQNGDSDMVFAQAGLGFNYHFSKDFSFRMDARYHVAFEDEFISFTTVDASLTWYLGRMFNDGVDNIEPLVDDTTPPAKLEDGAEASGNEKLLDVTPEGAEDTMHLELRVQFKKDSAILEPVDYPVLDELCMMINEALAANPDVYVTIDGHADRQHGSDYNYNLNLSKNRARSVAVYLNNAGIPMEKMQTAGHSFDKPLDPVNLDEGTPSNRRTEVVIRGVDAETRAKIRENRIRNKTK